MGLKTIILQNRPMSLYETSDSRCEFLDNHNNYAFIILNYQQTKDPFKKGWFLNAFITFYRSSSDTASIFTTEHTFLSDRYVGCFHVHFSKQLNFFSVVIIYMFPFSYIHNYSV